MKLPESRMKRKIGFHGYFTRPKSEDLLQIAIRSFSRFSEDQGGGGLLGLSFVFCALTNHPICTNFACDLCATGQSERGIHARLTDEAWIFNAFLSLGNRQAQGEKGLIELAFR